jgi:branched-chain amino acid transport system permease protein
VGAAVLHTLRDQIMPLTELWRLILGLSIIAMVLLFPRGLVGSFNDVRERLTARRGATDAPHAEVQAEGEPRSTHRELEHPSRLALAPQDEGRISREGSSA